jgi:Icc-related predicted phosphoesterase
MRILAAADLHGVLAVYRWLAEVACKEHVDGVVIAGDLFGPGWEAEQRAQTPEIISAMRNMVAPVFYLMGNDDFVPLEVDDEQLRFLHGQRIEFGENNFVGYQYTLPFVGTIFEKPEEEMARDLAALEPRLDARTVLVTHGPAHGSLDFVDWSGEHVGSKSLARLLERRHALAHIHGHIHSCFGRKGSHFNVASAGQKRAMIIELPSLKHAVLQE